MYQAHLSALGCADVLTDINLARCDFDGSGIDPERLRRAEQTWVSLITTCKRVAFEIVNGADSPNEAWRRLVQHYRASGLKERRRLTVEFYTLKMELGEHPRKFLLRVDRMVKELERVGRPVDPKDVDIVILSGFTDQYDAEIRMLESSLDWPMRDWIERAVINHFERLEVEKSAAGDKELVAAHGAGRNLKPPAYCSFCSQVGHDASSCRK